MERITFTIDDGLLRVVDDLARRRVFSSGGNPAITHASPASAGSFNHVASAATGAFGNYTPKRGSDLFDTIT